MWEHFRLTDIYPAIGEVVCGEGTKCHHIHLNDAGWGSSWEVKRTEIIPLACLRKWTNAFALIFLPLLELFIITCPQVS